MFKATNHRKSCPLISPFLPSPGDDLALSLRAARWLAPRFQGPTAARSDTEEENPFDPPQNRTDASAFSRAGGGREDDNDEPLQLLLELSAGRLGAGVDGLQSSLSLIAGAFRGLKSMRVRRAFAASLRAHLRTVQMDSVFRFDPPKFVGGGGAGEGTQGVPSPGRLGLPPVSNWASFRKYTVTLWIRPDPADGHGAATLFRFRNGEGVGVEAVLSPAVPDSAGHFPCREIVVTSFVMASAQKSFSARCKFGGAELADGEDIEVDDGSSRGEIRAGGGGGVVEGARMGGWRFVAVSHGQPLVKRAGRLRVSVDGEVVLETELQYPAGTGQSARDALSR